ncbi:hypothetical protein ACFCV3_41195 [Kribbella sp. NPDC056345]|uniref:hypothetical protein n=1 Tax=Kribbella sp. NPDC056345 TaxID=3345789 RepID=UPI0035D75B3C
MRARVLAMLPGPARKILGRSKRAVTEGGKTLAANVDRKRREAALPPTPEVPESEVRLFVGPANFAGQGTTWARAAERHLAGVKAKNMQYAGGAYRFPADIEVERELLDDRVWQDRQVEYLTSGNYTHVLIEAGRPVFGTRFARNAVGDVKTLKEAGVNVGLVAHGSDVRLPSRHAETHQWSPFHERDDFFVRLEAQAKREGLLFNTFDGPTFVSTPDLLVDVPGAKWLPVVIEPDRWANDEPVLERERPIVLHAPTNPRFKGTEYVEAAMQPLHDKGLIEYRRLTDIPSEEMPAAMAGADIVLEQFVLGPYSVTACEAMAAGRVVVVNVDEDVRKHVSTVTGRDLPIVHADPTTIGEVVEQIVADREAARAVAARGPEYVRAVHDGTMSSAVLGTWLTPGASQ